MTDYTKATNFTAKDSLPSGNANKIVKGSEIYDEFDLIATAVATKSNIASPTFTGTVTGPTIVATTAFVPDASDGAALGTTSLEFSDLFLADGSIIYFGADQDTTITHVADTGLLINSTRQLQFGDSGTYIHQSADGVLDLVSDTEIEINATVSEAASPKVKLPAIVALPVTVRLPPTARLPDTSAAPLISIVVAFISISVSDTRSSTPSAL